MSLASLADAASSLNEALHLHRTSTTAWETARTFFYASESHLPHLNQVSDPGIRLNSSQALPDTFTSQYRNVQFKSFMGLFPQINRAWLTVDSNLFLWGYTPFGKSDIQNDFYVFEGIHQVIVSVALVTPRPGVFVDSISYLLAVATPVEVTLLGVSFSPTGQLTLVPTQISIATDNIVVLKIVSSKDGRIFMAGSDGHLHEFVYGSQHSSSILNILSGRAPKRARKVSHSSSSLASYLLPASVRSYISPNKELIDLAVDGNSLFTLSQAGVLAVYDISSSVTLVATSHVASDAKHLFSYSIPTSDREFVSIHPVAPPFSASVQLIVVTSFAERIYYTTRPASTTSDSLRPTSLKCVTSRPGPNANMSRSSQTCVHIAWCYHGATVFANLSDNSSDRLTCIYPDSTLTASHSRNQNDGRSASLNSAEVVVTAGLDAHTPHTTGGVLMSDANPNEVQPDSTVIRTFAIADAEGDGSYNEDHIFMDAPSFFWVLTSTAVLLYERVQPIDKLSMLLSSVGDNSAEVTRFFERYGPGDTCAMALEIAISHPANAAVAAKVFYSGSETLQQKISSNHQVGGSDLGRTGRQATFDLGRPALRSVPLTRFSGAHEGAMLFMAKILHPVWGSYITSSREITSDQTLQLSLELMSTTRDKLFSVAEFFVQYSPEAMLSDSAVHEGNGMDGESFRRDLSFNTSTDGVNFSGWNNGTNVDRGDIDREAHHRRHQESEARRLECAALISLKDLAVRTAEALSLLVVVSEHQLHRLIDSMPKECVESLVDSRVCDLVSGEKGAALAASLVKAIFSVYPDETLAVSSAGRILRERCPSFFGESDVDLHRGLMMLRSAAESLSQNGISPDQQEWASMHGLAYRGTPDGRGDGMNHQRMNGQAKAEQAASILKTIPHKIFDVHSVCNDFLRVGALPSLIDVCLAIGKRAEADDNPMRAEQSYQCILRAIEPLLIEAGTTGVDQNESRAHNSLREASLHVAFKSSSDMFLRSLFEFLGRTKTGEEILLKNASAPLEKYLKETGSRHMLWRYYSQNEMFVEAAGILLNMAETEETTLSDRVNYLSCAMHNVNTAVSKGNSGASSLLKEISNFMEVAKVQMRIRDELARGNSDRSNVETALSELNGEILSLSKLFNQYARPFKLHEACLDALRCGSYRDDGYVRALWTEIIGRESQSSTVPSVLGHRIASLGREFYPSDVVFPTVFIIDLLERFVVQNLSAWQGNPDWVCETMTAVGVPLADVVDNYRKLVENPNGGSSDGNWSWSEEEAQLHLLRSTELAVRKLVLTLEDSPASRPQMSETDRATRALQICKSRLRSTSFRGSRELWEQFEDLERLLSNAAQ